MITIRGLSKVFPARSRATGPVLALSDVNLEIKDREFVTVLGPSGCGKTTLLRNVGGLLAYDEGEIDIDGRRVDGPGPDRAFVFQDFALLPWADVLRNVAFGLELRGWSRSEREAAARKMIELVGLEGFASHLPRELSGGMRQRVGLARALAVDPDTLLMDEPFGALDEQTRRLLQEQLLGIWQRY